MVRIGMQKVQYASCVQCNNKKNKSYCFYERTQGSTWRASSIYITASAAAPIVYYDDHDRDE